MRTEQGEVHDRSHRFLEMMMKGLEDYNVEEFAAYIFGFTVGIDLALQYPEYARALPEYAGMPATADVPQGIVEAYPLEVEQ